MTRRGVRELAPLLRQHGPWLIAASAVVAFLVESWPPRVQIDDAYIAYRYARNFVQGYGLVFNTGERVEGFTSPAWVLLVALGLKLGLEAPSVSYFMNLSSGVVLLGLSYVYATVGLEPGRRWLAAFAPWLLWSATAFPYWATSGLETPLLCVGVMLSLVSLAKDRIRSAALAAALAALTRPEGAVMLALVVAAHLYKRGLRPASSWVLPGACALFMAAITTARFMYYGALLPNTYYAKIGTIPFWLTGLYVGGFALAYVVPVALPAVLGVARVRALRFGGVWVVLNFAYVLYEGADAFSQFRFFLPALCPLLALATRGATTAWGDRKAISVLAVSGLPVALVWYHLGTVPGACAFLGALIVSLLAPRTIFPPMRVLFAAAASLVLGFSAPRALPRDPLTLGPNFASLLIINDLVIPRREALADVRKAALFMELTATQSCQRLSRAVPPVRSVASTGIGILSNCFPGRVIDLLGLTDATIAHSSPPRAFVAHRSILVPAHQRTNAAYVVRERPDYIFVPQPNEAVVLLPALLDFWSNSDFYKLYVWDPSFLGYRLRARDLDSSDARE